MGQGISMDKIDTEIDTRTKDFVKTSDLSKTYAKLTDLDPLAKTATLTADLATYAKTADINNNYPKTTAVQAAIAESLKMNMIQDNNHLRCSSNSKTCLIPYNNYNPQCRDIKTPFTPDGTANNAAMVSSLASHTLSCNDDEYLTKFHITRGQDTSGKLTNIQFQGRCCKLWDKNGAGAPDVYQPGSGLTSFLPASGPNSLPDVMGTVLSKTPFLGATPKITPATTVTPATTITPATGATPTTIVIPATTGSTGTTTVISSTSGNVPISTVRQA